MIRVCLEFAGNTLDGGILTDEWARRHSTLGEKWWMGIQNVHYGLNSANQIEVNTYGTNSCHTIFASPPITHRSLKTRLVLAEGITERTATRWIMVKPWELLQPNAVHLTRYKALIGLNIWGSVVWHKIWLSWSNTFSASTSAELPHLRSRTAHQQGTEPPSVVGNSCTVASDVVE